MKPSLAALYAVEAPPPGTGRFMSFADMRQLALGENLIPADGAAVVVPGERFTAFAGLDDLTQMESRINELKVEVMLAAKPAVAEVLRPTILIAETSTHPHELQYLQAMFIHHRQVLRALAVNKHLPEQTQRVLATDTLLKDDKSLQRLLASNPALTSSVMQAMWSETDDSIVQVRISENAAQQGKLYDGENDFARLCEAFYQSSADRSVRLAAIEGIRDPELLRRIASTNDVTFGAAELTAIAANRHTPDDVLNTLTKPAGMLQRVQNVLHPMTSSRIHQLAQQNLERRNAASRDATDYHSSPD
ncbi:MULTISPECIES: hypothetical protein [Cupriavidus]